MSQLTIVKKTEKDIIKDEFRRCASNPQYFMKKYCKIVHSVRGKMNFLLYPFQEIVVDEFLDNRYNIVLKARQLGLSTLAAMYSLWLMIFKKDQSILVVATQKDVAKNLITKIRYANQNLPSWMKIMPKEDNRLSLVLENGSNIKAVSANSGAVVSYALSLLIIDEASRIDNAHEIWIAAQPTISTGGNCIIMSSPHGMGNWFHEMWLDAEESKNGFNYFSLPWHLHPEHDQKWRDEETKRLGKRAASQEHDCDFLASGNNVVDAATLQFYEKEFIEDPKEKRSADKGLWIWDYPEHGKTYAIAADVARGDGSDYSAFHVFDVDNLVQVAEYKGKIDTRQFARILATVGTEYNTSLIVVERENIGWDVVQELIDIQYSNIFYSSNDLQYVDTIKQMTNKIQHEDRKLKPGFATTHKNRQLLISKIERYFEERELIVRSVRLINELKTFIWKNGKAQAQQGRNDDLVISLGILLWVRDTALRLRAEGINLTKKMLGGIGKAKHESVYVPGMFKENPYEYSIGDEKIDLKDWI